MAFGGILGKEANALALNNGVYDAGNYRISNVGDPINDGDTVNLKYYKEQNDGLTFLKKNFLAEVTFTPESGQFAYTSFTTPQEFLNYLIIEVIANNAKGTDISFDLLDRPPRENSDWLSFRKIAINNNTALNGNFNLIFWFTAVRQSSLSANNTTLTYCNPAYQGSEQLYYNMSNELTYLAIGMHYMPSTGQSSFTSGSITLKLYGS